MFTHFTQGSNNLPQAIKFYDALLAPLGIARRDSDNEEEIVCYQRGKGTLPTFFICKPFNDKPASAGNGSMIAFQANSQSEVDKCYQAGMDQGGTDEGPPGARPQYHTEYYGAYLRDPDGNKVHIVFRGDLPQT